VGKATRNRASIGYVVVLPGAFMAAFALSGIAIKSVNTIHRPSWSWEVVGFATNIFPAVLSGVFVYGLTALWLRRNGSFEGGSLCHVRRTLALYLVAVLCGVVVVRAWNSPDFGLWAQVPIWLGVSSIAGMGTDLIISLMTGRSGGDAA
jgi:hypothetical protein